MTPLSSTPTATIANANQRSHYYCSLATTTGFFASQNAAGIIQIHTTDPNKSPHIPAYGQLRFWSCADYDNPAPAGHITSLVCPGNHLTTITVAGLVALEHLDCSFNDLAFINLSNLPALKSLDITKNRLGSLDVCALHRLETLTCCGNLLARLDLTGRVQLHTVDCSMNELVSLKVGGCKSLHTLYAYHNRLSELDLNGLPELQHCDLSGNPVASRGFMPTF